MNSIVKEFQESLQRKLEDAKAGLKISEDRLKVNQDYQDYVSCKEQVAALEQALKDLQPAPSSCSCQWQAQRQIYQGAQGIRGY